MNVLVDTSVWSLAFPRAKPGSGPDVQELVELIREGRVVIIGPIRQELLSGIKSSQQFDLLRERLHAFPDLPLDRSDFEEAARLSNRARAKGIQGSNTDFLLCAVAMHRTFAIFTTDQDFVHYQRAVDVLLHDRRA